MENTVFRVGIFQRCLHVKIFIYFAPNDKKKKTDIQCVYQFSDITWYVSDVINRYGVDIIFIIFIKNKFYTVKAFYNWIKTINKNMCKFLTLWLTFITIKINSEVWNVNFVRQYQHRNLNDFYNMLLSSSCMHVFFFFYLGL